MKIRYIFYRCLGITGSMLFVLFPIMANGAEMNWQGGDIEIAQGDKLVISPNTYQNPQNVDISQGGILDIEPGTSLRFSQSFNNAGTVNINGSMDFPNTASSIVNTGEIIIENITDESQRNTFTYGGESFKDLLKNGTVQIGGDNAKSKSYLQTLTGQINDNNYPSAPINLYSRQLSTDTNPVISASENSQGKLDMGKWGRLYLSFNPVTISGDTIHLGTTSYGDVHDNHIAGKVDLTDTDMAILRGSDITLLPPASDNSGQNPGQSPNSDPLDYPGIPTVTLQSGIVQVGSGVNPEQPGYENTASLTIGKNGEGKLNLRGGALVLGSGGNAMGKGIVNGNLNIGGASNQSPRLDSSVIVRTGDWVVNGFVTLNKRGYLEVGKPFIMEDGQKVQSSLFVNGRLLIQTPYTIDDSVLKAKELIFPEDVPITFTNNAHGEFDTFEVNGPITLDGGSLTSQDTRFSSNASLDIQNGGMANLNNLSLNGAIINFDPPFIADGDLSNSSTGMLKFESDKIDGRINVGRNSMVTLGSDDPEWLRSRIIDYQTKNSLLWGRDITAALAIRSPQVLASNGGLNVDGSWVNGGTAAQANTARFADKSLFVIDGSSLKNQIALDGNGTATLQVEKGAKLFITDVAVGDTIKVTDNFASGSVSEEGWSKNTATSTDMLNVESELVNPATGEYIVRVTEGKSPVAVFPALVPELAEVVGAASEKGLNTNANTAGRRFIARAVDIRFIGNTDSELAAATLESAARIAVIGAAPQMTRTANEAAGAAITQRTSLAQPDGALRGVDQNGMPIHDNGMHANSFALWIMPLYQSTNGFGMEAGSFDYDFNDALGGVALGADYTLENMLRLGVSFNIGGGYARGSGDLNKTTNNMNFWGVGAYAGWTKNNFGLSADINYTSTYNKIKQELPAQMEMGDLKSDISSWAISTGLRAEYKLETAYLDIIPHAEFRFMNLNTDSYDAKSNGATVINGDSFTQNIWTFPLGVSFTKNCQLENGWRVKPLLVLNVTPAAGDIKAKSKIRFSGITEEAELETKMMDYVTYGGTAGIEIGNDSVSLGVSYNGQFGAESSAHGIFGTFRYEF